MLAFCYRRTGQGLSGARVVRMLLPGACLLLALRAALAGNAAALGTRGFGHGTGLRTWWTCAPRWRS